MMYAELSALLNSFVKIAIHPLKTVAFYKWIW